MSDTVYRTMADVRSANAAAGHHWFDPATLRFFRSRVGRTLYAGRYFITSEQMSPSYDRSTDTWHYFPRRWSIRIANDDGSIDTVGEFDQYESYAQARAAIRKLTA